MVRGSALRVTGLTSRGALPNEISYVASRSVAKVTINEVADGGGSELLRNEEDEPRLHFVENAQTIKYTAEIAFTKCDPAILNLLTGVPVVIDANGDIVGFDSNTRLPLVSFAMEVWSRLAGQPCDDSGARRWGYSLFPHLKGGHLAGFEFANGLVSFSVVNAAVQRFNRWAEGPYDLVSGNRLSPPIPRTTFFRPMVLAAQPPEPTNGVVVFSDLIDGGSPAFTTAGIIDGGDPDSTTPDIINGGSVA